MPVYACQIPFSPTHVASCARSSVLLGDACCQHVNSIACIIYIIMHADAFSRSNSSFCCMLLPCKLAYVINHGTKANQPSFICIHSRNGQGLLPHGRPKLQMAALLCLAKPYQMSCTLSMVLYCPSGMGYSDCNKHWQMHCHQSCSMDLQIIPRGRG